MFFRHKGASWRNLMKYKIFKKIKKNGKKYEHEGALEKNVLKIFWKNKNYNSKPGVLILKPV